LTVTGFPYTRGLKRLAETREYPARIWLVTPAHARLGKGELRIIGERQGPCGLELLLSYEDYE